MRGSHAMHILPLPHLPAACALPPHAQGYIIDHNLRRVPHRYVTGDFVYERVIALGGRVRKLMRFARTRARARGIS